MPAFFLDSSSNDDTRPRISSPSRFGTPWPHQRTFLVTWQRNSDPFSNYGRLHCAAITTDSNQPLINRWDLSALLSIPTSTWCYEPTVDCDGTRFAVAHGEVPASLPGTGHANLYVSTVAVDGAQLLVHESKAVLQNTGPQTFSPSILSRFGGNLGNTRTYSVVGGTDVISVVGWIYNGHQPGTLFGVRPAGCGNLPITYSGYPTFGDQLGFDLGGTNAFRGLRFGFPAPLAAIPGCAGCTIGVTGGGNVPVPYVWHVPYIPSLVGLPLSVQGYGVGSGPCFGAIELSDVVDFTLR